MNHFLEGLGDLRRIGHGPKRTGHDEQDTAQDETCSVWVSGSVDLAETLRQFILEVSPAVVVLRNTRRDQLHIPQGVADFNMQLDSKVWQVCRFTRPSD